MKFVIICISLSLLFSVTTAAKAWDSPLFSMQEEFEKNFDDKRNNLRSRESYLERTEEDLLKEEEALLESIVERYGHSDDDDDNDNDKVGNDDDDDKDGDDDDHKDGDDDDHKDGDGDDDDSGDRNGKYDNYLGCFKDEEERDLPDEVFPSGYLTVDVCKRACRKKNKKYAGIQTQTQCFCGNDYGRYGKTASSNCFVRKQRGGATGGNYANSIYKA